ncbi:MAG: prepilin peptidase [Synergistetes bacterium]|nr:prepilin peptidase [Synergistota bacterium]MCX8128258.1 prepilin peptidase [Synergistota bacterium]MDW8192705.1 prepilin peptidase [Synergistota bacterium]
MEAIVFLLGLIIGSFLNSCIYRLPRGVSIIYPPSFCPSCGHKLCWSDLVPIFSYLALKGKCRYCGVKIPLRYPLIELLTGFLFLVSYYKFGLSYDFIFSSFFLSLLEFVAIVDLRSYEVMDSTIYLGIIMGIIFFTLKSGAEGFFFSLKGIIYGAGIMALIFFVANGGMGEGDIGIAAFVGAWLGSVNTIVALVVAFIIGGIFAVLLLALGFKKMGEKVPFGPFLAIGSTIAFFKGELLIELYWRVIS